MGYLRSFSVPLVLALFCSSALADDWIADRLRGEVLLLANGDWIPLARGAVVPNGASVRTGGDGRAELVRGEERIDLAASTQIALRDAGDQKMTNVIQHHGVVTIEAEHRNIQHFSVQTPVLAAVVKGTQFTVSYRNGQASVSVDRGEVQVQDPGHDMIVNLLAGQLAEASQSSPVDLSGPGAESAVFLIAGSPVPAVARDVVLDGQIAPEDAVAAVRDGVVLPGPNGRGVLAPDHQGGVGGAGKANGNASGGQEAAGGPARPGGPGEARPANGPGGQGGPGNGNGHAGPGNSKSNGPQGGPAEREENGPGPKADRDGPSSDRNSGPGNRDDGPGAKGNGGPSGGPSGPSSPPDHSNENGPPAHSNAGGGGGPGGNGPPEHSNAGGKGHGKD